MTERYGVKWPDGSFTGAITDKYGLAAAYAKSDGGKAYHADANGNPIDDEVITEKEDHDTETAERIHGISREDVRGDKIQERIDCAPTGNAARNGPSAAAAKPAPVVGKGAQGAFAFLE